MNKCLIFSKTRKKRYSIVVSIEIVLQICPVNLS